MKKILLLITCIIFSISTFGQAPSAETFGLTVPTGATKLTKDHFISIVHSNYKNLAISAENKTTYQLGGLIISYWGLSVNPDFQKSIEALQRENLGYMKRDVKNTMIDSKIVKVNEIKFLVYEYSRGDDFYLRFQSEFDKNRKNINGLILYKKQDEENAHIVLNKLLLTIHFKE